MESLVRSRLTSGVILALGITVGCGGSPSADRPRPPPAARSGAIESGAEPIELFSWWNRIGSADAFGAVLSAHRREVPGDVVINASVELSGQARKTLRARLLRGEPPDLFQANAGFDLMQWVLMNGLDARDSKIQPLDDVIPDVARWKETIPGALLNQVTAGGKLYALPANVHRINSLFYSQRVLDRFGMKPPKTFDELLAMGRRLKVAGIDLLAVGSREPWTLALLVMESMFPARGGAALYREYFEGKLQPDDPRMIRTLQAALELRPYVNSDHPRLSWLQAMEHVISGRAALAPIGDWAGVAFTARGLEFGRDYGEVAFPGTDDMFVFTADTFAVPAGAKNIAGARRLLTTLAAPDTQAALARAKHAIPARTGVDPAKIDADQREKYRTFATRTLLVAQSGMVPGRFARDVNAAFAEMFQLGRIDPVVQTLRSRYALLWLRNGWNAPETGVRADPHGRAAGGAP